MLATSSNNQISENEEPQLTMQRADPALCSLLFVSLSLALVTHDIQESNLIQTCSCARIVKGAGGIMPAWCAYKLGELTIPCICSSFLSAFVAGSISNNNGHLMNNPDYRSVTNDSPAMLRDWQVSHIRHTPSHKPAFTFIQNTDRARMHKWIFKLNGLVVSY